MKIVVTSDIHGDTALLNKVKMIEYNASYFLDAGDSQFSPCEISTIASVKGNMDYFIDLPFVRHIEICDIDIIIYHGNFALDKNEIKNNTKIIISGHTHVARIDFNSSNNCFLINPGSLSRPRDDVFGSYAIIYIDENSHEIKAEIKRI